MARVIVDGNTLSLDQIEAVARGGARVELSPRARERVSAARRIVEARLDDGEAHYGINTGFGTLAEVRIPRGDLERLQRNLILSHAAGVGAPLSAAEARALVLLRANVLAKGHSGIRQETLDLVLALLDRDCIPVVPERGSVGASGDLAPLAHLALLVIGEGEGWVGGHRLPGREALARVGLRPVVLQAKEGLALVNGTQAMVAVGALAQVRADRLAALADLAGAMTLEGLLGSHRPFLAGDPAGSRPAGPDSGRCPPARTARRLTAQCFPSGSRLPQGPGPLLAPLHAPGSRRCSRRAGILARRPGPGGQRCYRQPAGLRRVRRDRLGRQLPRAAGGPGARRARHRRITPRHDLGAARRAARQPHALGVAALPGAQSRARLRLHDRPGHQRRAGLGEQDPGPPGQRRLHSLVCRPRGSRVDGHDRGTEGPVGRREREDLPRHRAARRRSGSGPATACPAGPPGRRGAPLDPGLGPPSRRGPAAEPGHRGGVPAGGRGRAGSLSGSTPPRAG